LWEIDEQITRPLTLRLHGIDGVKTVRGSTDGDCALVHPIFEERVRYAAARSRVLDRMASPPPFPTGVVVKAGPDGLESRSIPPNCEREKQPCLGAAGCSTLS
jgi:Cu(I)/Ag(I) efflux system membrane protein CusA/SilA